MADAKTVTPKFLRCEDACVEVLRHAHPRMLGHRRIAIILADPYRTVAVSPHETRLGVSETFCDEFVRKTLNALVEEGRISQRFSKSPGLTMKVFGVIAI